MIILNNMYTGRYITEQGNLGHEAINLIKADDGKFYIWLNSMGVCCKNGVDDCTVIMVRSINSHLYKVLAKGEKCTLCAGANIPRKKKNMGTTDKEERYQKQKTLGVDCNGKAGVTYNGKRPMEDIYNENDMFATFCTDKVYETEGDVYLTNDENQKDEANGIYYADFKISEAMRAYIENKHSAYSDLSDFLQKDFWKELVDKDISKIKPPEFNFFKLIRKERDELSLSNALAYFIQNADEKAFLEGCLHLNQQFLDDKYQLLREKNNIDISFFGEENVIIIENKIDAGITADNRMTLDRQIKRAVDFYFTDMSDTDKKVSIATINGVIGKYSGNVSQLSKYYIYAVAYLLNKGLDVSKIEEHIKCFLLIPEYARNHFKTDNNGGFDSDFLLSDKYKIITYKEIDDFFSKANVDTPYFEDFLSALTPLKSEFNNELEEEMKYRFYKAIGKI